MSWTNYETWIYALAKSCGFHEYLEFALLARALADDAVRREVDGPPYMPGLPADVGDTRCGVWTGRGRE